MSVGRVANSWIGAGVCRLEDLRFVRGRGVYVDDVDCPAPAHAVILRSQVAHGRIARLDVEAAARLPGVLGIITADDIPNIPKIPLRMEPRPELMRFIQPVLAVDTVRYVGEPLAVIVGETISQAHDALSAIVVDIDALPAITDARAAATSAFHSFPEHGTNLAIVLSGVMGDVEGAFAAADYTRREVFRVHRHTANPMEPRGLLAQWNAESGRLLVHGSCKVPFAIRAALARDLVLDVSAIEVVESDVGGGFGVRGEYYPEDFLIPFAARHFNQPVKWIETRQEHFVAAAHAREVEIELELACTRDGTLLGLRGKAWSDMGAYIRPNAVTAPRNIAQVASGPYRVPHVHMDVAMVMTTKTPAGSYRGPGRYEIDFARERLLDLAARDLGLDRVVLRQRNLISADEMPYAMPEVLPYGSGTRCDSGDYASALHECLHEIGWARLAAQAGTCIDGKFRGLGVGCYIEGGGSGPKEHAVLKLDANCRVAVYVGSSALGQGLETVFAQIAADALEISMDAITGVFHGSTSYVEEGFGSYASRSVVMGGNAIVNGAQALRARLRELAAVEFGTKADEIVLEGLETVRAGGRKLAIAALVRKHAPEGLTVPAVFTNSDRTYSYGTHAAHVAVDPQTGVIEVLDYVAVEDVGRIINPETLKGQVHGAIVQGLGATVLEELAYDAEGQLLSGSFMDYGMPIATNFPRIRVVTTENWPSPFNPLGAKGAGEGGIIPVAGVISNAVASALVSLGVEPHDLPLTASRLWDLIRTAQMQGNRAPEGR